MCLQSFIDTPQYSLCIHSPRKYIHKAATMLYTPNTCSSLTSLLHSWVWIPPCNTITCLGSHSAIVRKELRAVHTYLSNSAGSSTLKESHSCFLEERWIRLMTLEPRFCKVGRQVQWGGSNLVIHSVIRAKGASICKMQWEGMQLPIVLSVTKHNVSG